MTMSAGGLTMTLRSLVAPRRLVPIVIVAGTLAAVQLYYEAAPVAAIVPAGMSAAFVALAPWSWRVLVANGGAIGCVLYALEAVAVVLAFGVALPHLLDLGPTFLTDPGSLVVAGVLYVIGGWGLGRDIELELDLDHAQQKAIRAHLDPHFLFNTLNAIAEWCREDPAIAEDATLRLAQLLRDVQDGLERRSWPLARELAVVRDFLELHRVRDREAFTFVLPDDVPDDEVPPLVVLSLVENAVKHGPRKGHRGAIVVGIERAPRLRIEIENPGPFAPSHEDGRGLALVRRRLALSYGNRARLDIRALGDDRTRAEVTVS